MSSAFWILAVLLTGLVGSVILFPLLQRTPPPATMPGRPRGTIRQNQALETLWTEKLRVLRAIRDLDFDYDMDKLPDAAYETQRIDLIRLALAITHRIDAIEAEIAGQEARLEDLVSAYRAGAGPQPMEDVTPRPAAASSTRRETEKSGGKMGVEG